MFWVSYKTKKIDAVSTEKEEVINKKINKDLIVEKEQFVQLLVIRLRLIVDAILLLLEGWIENERRCNKLERIWVSSLIEIAIEYL